MKLKKNYLFFNVNNIHQAIETTSICRTNKILPIFCIKFYIINGFGADWITEFRNLLLKKFNTKDFKILVYVHTVICREILIILLFINVVCN